MRHFGDQTLVIVSYIPLLIGERLRKGNVLTLICNFINQVMLMNPEWSESQESCVVLQETPACAAIFGDFIQYFYTGQIRINHLRVMPILALADKYNVKVGKVCQ
jgi:BTB/POZ domain.